MKTFLCAIALAAAMAVEAAPAMKAAGPHESFPCTTCHAEGRFAAPAKEACFACHTSYDKVAGRTAKMNPNPHMSHRGEPDCANCHSMHGQSRFECNDCHTFNIRMK